jgi:pSer/pThr/pTyr-binding forkhead associated (FHA) protein
MAERSWTIGSSAECDICVEHPTVSGRHCRLTTRGDTFLLEDLGSTNGTFVAGQRIDKPRIVRSGDDVTLGQSIPLPWPTPAISITIGRIPGNDVVIPLDTVSSRHARLERDGARLWLVDEGSTNGTAVGNPLNKIERVLLKPGDIVFLGTHRVAAAELLAALPQPPRRAGTLLEASAPIERQPVINSPAVAEGSPFASVRTTVAKRRRRPNSFAHPVPWVVGAVLSVFISGAILHSMGRLDFLAQSAPSEPSPRAAHAPERRSNVNHGTTATTRDPSQVSTAPARIERPEPHRQPPAESLVRTYVPALVLVGYRVDRQVGFSGLGAVGWAYRPDVVVCPTEFLDGLEKLLAREAPPDRGLDARLAVFTPRQTLAILKHVAGSGPADGFSLAVLEAPLESSCRVAIDSSTAPRVGQPLAILLGSSQNDDSKTITWNFASLVLDQIGREPAGTPNRFFCRGQATFRESIGAPVFDGAGNVVGCVRAVSDTVEVVPTTCLSALLKSIP